MYCAIQIRRPALIELFANKLLNTANEAQLEEKRAVVQRFMGIAFALRQGKNWQSNIIANLPALAIEQQFGEYQGYWCLRSYCTLQCILALLAVKENCLGKERSYPEKADVFLQRYHDRYQAGLL